MTVPMTERLTRDNLHGVWAAIATPFDEQDRFDEGTFRENLRRLAASGVHGIYTTDSDGEFYAIELDEFRRIVEVFADETQRLGIPTQVGVTWSHTQGMVDRLKIAAERGILGAHVGHPFFMPMSPESYRVFWDDIQRAVPDWFGLIHYNTPRVHNYQYGPDYARLLEQAPNLIGTKHVGSSVPEFLTLMQHAPQLSHFTGEHAMTPFMFMGARGIYSWFVNFNAPYMVAWYDAIQAGDWDEARRRQQRLHAFSEAIKPLHGEGNLHGIIGKALTAASDFLVPANRTRRPYLPVPDETIRQVRRRIEAEFPDLLWQGGH
jgi:4-hydroxy-tetrahydrodipicolinate synthase